MVVSPPAKSEHSPVILKIAIVSTNHYGYGQAVGFLDRRLIDILPLLTQAAPRPFSPMYARAHPGTDGFGSQCACVSLFISRRMRHSCRGTAHAFASNHFYACANISHRSVHVPFLGRECACDFFDIAARVRYPWLRTAHAVCSE